MTRKFFAFALILTFSLVLYAQGDKQVKITGYIMDNACSNGHVNDANFSARVKKHSTSCALMPDCESSGYAVFSEGKLYKLDAAGNKEAADLLKATETKNGVMVAVEGTLDGDTIKVSKLSEVKVAAE